MRNYESEMEHASAVSGEILRYLTCILLYVIRLNKPQTSGEKASGKELLGEMHEIYYGNRFNIVLG